MSLRGVSGLLLLAGAVVAAVLIPNRGADRDSRTVTKPVGEEATTEDLVVKGLLSGVVKRADGTAASDATVFLDAWFQNLGEADNKLALDVRSAFQAEDGKWEWQEDTEELPKHEPFKTPTDADGRYFFEDTQELRTLIDEDRVKIWAELDDQVSPKVLVRAESGHVRVEPLTLGPALRPEVRIVTFAGAPVVDAHVDLTLSVEDQLGDSRYELLYGLGARTDKTGLAVFPAVPERSDWGVWIRVNPNDMPRHLEIDASLPRLRGKEPLELRISTGCTVRGRVELPDGLPGTSVSVSARRDEWDPNPNAGHSTETAEDGSFELRGVPIRDSVLEFVESPWLKPGPPNPEQLMRTAGEAAHSRLTMRVRGREGQVVDLGTVRLSPTLTICGKVLGPDGKPPKRGYVMLEAPSSSHDLEPDGSFVIGGLEPGRHTINATVFEDDDPWEDGIQATMKDVEAGSADVVVRVTGGGNLIVRFHPLGQPDKDLEVWEPSICWGHCGGGAGRKCSEMRMTFEPGRRNDIRVEAEGYKTKFLGLIEIHADRKTVVDVELEPAD